jgi:hypothetical protein
MSEEESIQSLAGMKESLEPIQGLEGFALYQEWRKGIFHWIRGVLEKSDSKQREALNEVSEMLTKDFGAFLELGFFHEAYKDNIFLSMDAFITHFENPSKLDETLNILDKYVRPPSKITEDFKHSYVRTTAGFLAHILTNHSTSEHLALEICRQIFGYKSETTAYEPLKKIRNEKFPAKDLPPLANLILFGTLHYNSANWSVIKPRAKHTRSIRELQESMDAFANFRKDSVLKEISQARRGFENNPEPLKAFITPEFQSKILEFSPETEITDELAATVFFASYFGNPLKAVVLPDLNNLPKKD